MSFRLESDGVLRLSVWDGLSWLVHGFSTRAAGNFSSLPAADGLPGSLRTGGMDLRALRQVHSDRLHTITAQSEAPQSSAPSSRPEADGLFTRAPGQLLSVRTADCLPLLFLDRQSRTVAAVHAGWRGSAKGIAARAVEVLQRECGVPASRLEVAIGPGIGPCCYEVGEEVAAQFDPGVVARGSHPHLDLEAANRRQLLAAGVADEKVWAARQCTCCLAEQFFSYRREGAAAGRMVSVIGVRRPAMA